MITNQIIASSIDELSSITKKSLLVFESGGRKIAGGDKSPDKKHIESFISSEADSQTVGNWRLFKVYDDEEALYVVASEGTDEDSYTVGRIAVSQLQALITAYKEKMDRDGFFQNLLLDNLLMVDIINRAKKLKIEALCPRVVYLVNIKNDTDGIAAKLLKEMFTKATGDAVTNVDGDTLVLVKNIQDGDSVMEADELEEIANQIVSMIGTEGMLSARVAYGSVAADLQSVSRSYKEAKVALDVGSIFYADKNVTAYTKLGIGRLIYQLPENLCHMFIDEVLGDEMPAELDEETIATLDKFFENNLNVSETSRQLFVHRNTLVYRIDKVQRAIGLDLRNFDDALTFKIAMMVQRYLEYKEKNQ